jgi:hypothetical protein
MSTSMTAAGVGLQQASATFSQSPQSFYGVHLAIDGSNDPTRGWAIDPQEGQAQTAVFETVMNAGSGQLDVYTFTLTQSFSVATHTLGHFRLSVTTDDRALFADGLASGGDVTAHWTVIDPTSVASRNGATLTELDDHSILASGPSPAQDVYTVTTTLSLAGITGFRLEALPDPSLPAGGPGRYGPNGNFVLNEFAVDVASVPEPGTYVLMVAGLGLMGVLSGRRQRRT